MFTYRDEDEKVDKTKHVDETSDDGGLAAFHCIEEWEKWRGELDRWQEFKDAQLINNQLGRSEIELELENTDEGLVEALSRVNDWQEFEFIQQNKVHEEEMFHAKCQKGITRFQNAMVAASGAESKQEFEPRCGWMLQMEKCQKRLKTSQEELRWTKGQWTEVLAETSSSLAAEPKLQKQLEDKLEKQTNAIYRRLKQMGARPSHAVQHPNENAGFPQRLQHWISESSCFTAELWDWRVFMAWRQYVKGADTKNQEGQKQDSQVPSCSELLEDLVKLRQYEIDKAISWVDCWRSRVRQYTEARKKAKLEMRARACWPALKDEEDEEDEDELFLEDDEDYIRAQQAEQYAIQAEEKVSDAEKQLERAKEELQRVLAECVRPSMDEISGQDSKAELPPTPTKSQSPQVSPSNRTLLNNSSQVGKGHPRLEEERASDRGTKTTNTNTEQHDLPTFLDEDHDTEMSDVPESSKVVEAREETKGVEYEDTVMSEVEDPTNHRPTTNTDFKKSASPRAHGPTTRKTRSSTNFDQAMSGRVTKNINKKPAKKVEKLTEQQTMALFTASTDKRPTNHTSPRRSDRLKEKAAASTVVLPPTQPPQPNAGASSGPSNHKKRKLQSDDSEPIQTQGRRSGSYNQIPPNQPKHQGRKSRDTIRCRRFIIRVLPVEGA